LVSYDLTVFVVEPTLKSISVVKDYLHTAPERADSVVFIANKVSSEQDLRFIRAHLDEGRLIASLPVSPELRRFEQGESQAFEEFIKSSSGSFESIFTRCRQASPDRSAMLSALTVIHKKNCEWWYNDYHGERLDTGLDSTEGIFPPTS
jgi:hypothetical protein